MALKPKKLVLPLVILALVLVAVWMGVTKSIPVEVRAVRRGPVRSFVEEEGRTRVVERYVLASPVSGRLLRVKREEGDAVAEGEVLAEIDPLALRSRVEQAEARMRGLAQQLGGVDRKRPKPEELEHSRLMERRATDARDLARRELEEAIAAHDKARLDADRARELNEKGVVTDAAREAAELAEIRMKAGFLAGELRLRVREVELKGAALETKILEESAKDVDWEEAFHRESLKALEAELAVLVDDLGRARITAPVAGILLRRYIESETPVAAGTPILEVGDLSRLEVEADVLSEDASHMRPGMQVEVFGRALEDEVLLGSLARIHPSAFKKISSLGVEQQRVMLVIAFDPAGTSLGDRYRVDIRVILDQRADAVLVPEAALFRMEGEWHVFKADGGRARLVAVKTGLRDGRVREVIEGLAEGDRVIVHPEDTLAEGTRIEVTERK